MGNKEMMEERRTKKERILAAGVWRNERKREVEEEDLEEGRERERSRKNKKKKEQQIDRRQREAQRNGESPSSENSPPVLLGLAALPTTALSLISLFLFLSLFVFFSLSLSLFFCVPRASSRATIPYPTISLAPLEARQMSGIRLRHLSVSSSVTFDSRQIERRACQEREEERKRGAAFYRGAR